MHLNVIIIIALIGFSCKYDNFQNLPILVYIKQHQYNIQSTRNSAKRKWLKSLSIAGRSEKEGGRRKRIFPSDLREGWNLGPRSMSTISSQTSQTPFLWWKFHQNYFFLFEFFHSYDQGIWPAPAICLILRNIVFGIFKPKI